MSRRSHSKRVIFLILMAVSFSISILLAGCGGHDAEPPSGEGDRQSGDVTPGKPAVADHDRDVCYPQYDPGKKFTYRRKVLTLSTI